MGGKSPKAQDTSGIIRAQEEAAEKERQRLAQESALAEADRENKAAAAAQEAESRRQSFAGQLASTEDDEERRRFLKGA